MKKLTSIAGEAVMGIGLGLGMTEREGIIESNPAHVALVHGSAEAETPALKPMVEININRAERRRLGVMSGELYVPEDSPAHTEIIEAIQKARMILSARKDLYRRQK